MCVNEELQLISINRELIDLMERLQPLQSEEAKTAYELVSLAGNKRVEAVIVDPSAASFMECIRREGKFRVIPAKNQVSDGIRKVSEKLKQGKIIISSSCADTIREFSMYRWDCNSVNGTPKKEYDHAMDDIRYFVATALENTDNSFFALSVERN